MRRSGVPARREKRGRGFTAGPRLKLKQPIKEIDCQVTNYHENISLFIICCVEVIL